MKCKKTKQIYPKQIYPKFKSRVGCKICKCPVFGYEGDLCLECGGFSDKYEQGYIKVMQCQNCNIQFSIRKLDAYAYYRVRINCPICPAPTYIPWGPFIILGTGIIMLAWLFVAFWNSL
jgi:hypothetical protein